jgi:hypothetical protein
MDSHFFSSDQVIKARDFKPIAMQTIEHFAKFEKYSLMKDWKLEIEKMTESQLKDIG